MTRHLFCQALGAVCLLGLIVQGAAANLTISPNAGYNIFWLGGDANFFSATDPAPAPINVASTTGTAIGSTAHPAPAHTIAHINDGLYGNSNSWIADPGDATPFIGVSLGAASVSINSFAFGRDNGNNVTDACGGQCTDRNLFTYTLQFTTVASPTSGTPFTGSAATGWESVGTITYLSHDDAAVGGAFTGYFRHDFGVTDGGAPLSATGLRLAPSSNAAAIDELEIYTGAALNVPLTLTATGGSYGPDNIALGGTAFASGVLLGFPAHNIPNLNDGLYGNDDSWIGDGGADFVGIDLGGEFLIDSFAFGRDNGGEATQFMDRTDGSYVLQYTTAENPDETTPDSEWITIGGLSYAAGVPDATPWLRHLYEFEPVVATGIRLHVGPNGLSGGVAIDELEVFGTVVPEPASIVIWTLLGLIGGVLGWRRHRNGR